MDIAAFCDADPARRGSPEFEYGRDWTDGDGNRTEVSWIAATGAVAEKSSWDDVPWQDLLREMLAIHAA
jgi:hypothetical protein